MSTQLRLYTINRGYLQQFADEWKDSVLPLRKEYGFQILGAWTIVDTNQFAWLMSYSGDQSWTEQDAAYYASTARAKMNPNPARLIARIEENFVDSIIGEL